MKKVFAHFVLKLMEDTFVLAACLEASGASGKEKAASPAKAVDYRDSNRRTKDDR
jgi:hypothetical protein